MKLVHLPLTFMLSTAAILNGCGGSGTTSSSTPITAPEEAEIVLQDTVFEIGRSIELTLYSENSISNINWSQTAGESLTILSPSAKLISVLPTASGSYTVEVSFVEGGQSKSLNMTFDVEEQTANINVPNGQAVVAGNKVSLRLFSETVFENINWRQTSGTPINLSEDDSAEQVLIFTAPNVLSDDLLQFEVTGELNGERYLDTVSVLVEGAPAINENAYFDDRVAKVFTYNQNSPYADNLVNCVYSNSLTSSCQLEALPLIAHDTLSPTIDDIMDRVVVSHQWMGDRFKQFLVAHDDNDDFKRLLRATTGVVISYDVRPSFYWAATGAIYLDPNNLWLTQLERDTINEAPDFRSGFGQELQFVIPWRYVKDDEYAFKYYDASERQDRALSDLIYPLGYLLYHELAHANDFFPAAFWDTLSSNDRILDAAFEQNPISDNLSVLYPLASDTLKSLAQVRFAGTTATSTEKSYLPPDITAMFEPDGAVHFYSYSTEREDYAMLFEELMMQHRYDVYRDVAVTNNPEHQNDNSSDYFVDWGQRGRLAEPHIKDRLQYVVDNVLPEFDSAYAIENLPSAKLFTPGLTWRENLNLSGQKAKQATSIAEEMLRNSQPRNHPQLIGGDYYTKPLPARNK